MSFSGCLYVQSHAHSYIVLCDSLWPLRPHLDTQTKILLAIVFHSVHRRLCCFQHWLRSVTAAEQGHVHIYPWP